MSYDELVGTTPIEIEIREFWQAFCFCLLEHHP